jgi:hypothetical protein
LRTAALKTRKEETAAVRLLATSMKRDLVRSMARTGGHTSRGGMLADLAATQQAQAEMAKRSQEAVVEPGTGSMLCGGPRGCLGR